MDWIGDKVEHCSEGQDVTLWQGEPMDQDVVMPEEEWVWCSGLVLWELGKAVCAVLTWEIVRCSCGRRTTPRGVPVDAGSQTNTFEVVPLPLSGQVRCRAKILFCLWCAGFKVDVEGYPERIQSEFHALVGGYLVRVESGGVSSSDSG